MLQKIILQIIFGSETKTVEMVNPFCGGGQYHVYIDRIYQGQLAYWNGMIKSIAQR